MAIYLNRHLQRRIGLKPRQIETQEQAEVARWLIGNDVFFTASANGARTSMIQAVKLKRLGCRAGVPDLFIFEPRGAYHGLFVEMKRPKIEGVCAQGAVSKDQKDFIAEAEKRGYKAIVCYGAEQAIEAIKAYLML